MRFLHSSSLDTFMEWESGVLVTPAGTLRLRPWNKRQAAWLFAPAVPFYEFQPPEELLGN